MNIVPCIELGRTSHRASCCRRLTRRRVGVRYAHDRPSLLSQGEIVGLRFPVGNVDERGWGFR